MIKFLMLQVDLFNYFSVEILKHTEVMKQKHVLRCITIGL